MEQENIAHNTKARKFQGGGGVYKKKGKQKNNNRKQVSHRK